MTAPAPYSETEGLRLKAEGIIKMLGVRAQRGSAWRMKRNIDDRTLGTSAGTIRREYTALRGVTTLQVTSGLLVALDDT
jgi:hypothetical protein